MFPDLQRVVGVGILTVLGTRIGRRLFPDLQNVVGQGILADLGPRGGVVFVTWYRDEGANGIRF